jgi:hypothetical protein
MEAMQPLKKWVAVSTLGVPGKHLGLSYGVVESFWLWPIAGHAHNNTEFNSRVIFKARQY